MHNDLDDPVYIIHCIMSTCLFIHRSILSLSFSQFTSRHVHFPLKDLQPSLDPLRIHRNQLCCISHIPCQCWTFAYKYRVVYCLIDLC